MTKKGVDLSKPHVLMCFSLEASIKLLRLVDAQNVEFQTNFWTSRSNNQILQLVRQASCTR